jgi:phosphoribosylcarboxyaminoimidazole (NCAIR) mutase
MRILVAVLAVATAMPVISIPVTSDAQVLTRRSSAAPRRAPRATPRLTDAEQDSLYAAQDLVVDLTAEITALETSGREQGALTDEQRTQLEAHTARRTQAQAEIDRLIAKRGY